MPDWVVHELVSLWEGEVVDEGGGVWSSPGRVAVVEYIMDH